MKKEKITTKDEYNQFGHAMSKPLSYGCIKKMKSPTLLEFKGILDSLSHGDNVGHLLDVDTKFHNRNSKTMLFDKIYAPIFEKNKTVWAYK